MKICITGRGGAGSWQIRAVQIGAVLNAHVCQMATIEEMQAADVVLVVKRVPLQLLTALRKAKRPWVYDILDAFPQPECGSWYPEQAKAWVKEHVERLNPTAVIWPNQRMREDAGGRGKVVYHHARPFQPINPIRERILTVGYEGEPNYVQEWAPVIATECKRIGAAFMVNPPRLADVDVVLAVRGKRWDGYAQQNFKSNVKLANAHATGTPFIGMRECGYTETATGAERFISNRHDLASALDSLADQQVRRDVALQFRAAERTIEEAANETLEVLRAARC